jgi:uncharacterized membrane protein YkvA (DUF1232 family)
MFNPADALASPAFKQCIETAKSYLGDPSKASQLLANSNAKLDQMEASRGPVGDAVRAGRTGVRMIQAYVEGRYKAVPVKSLVSIAAALLYFIQENDLIDDSTPFIGYVDDAGVIMLALKMIQGDLDAFVAWEQEQAATTH